MKNFNQIMATMFALLIVAFSVKENSFILSMLLEIHSTGEYLLIIPVFVLYLIPLLVGLYLFINPKVLDKFLKFKSTVYESEINLKNVLQTTIVLMGLYISVFALIYLIQEALKITLYLMDSKNKNMEFLITAETKAEVLSYFIELIVGIMVAFKSGKLSAYFIKE